MKVSIYKLPDGTMDALVEASPGNGKAPVVLRGVTPENVVGVVLPVVREMKGRRVGPVKRPGE